MSRSLRRSFALALSLSVAASLLSGCAAIQLQLARAYSEPGPVSVPDDIEVIRDVAFATPEGAEAALLLDVFLPKERASDSLPVVLFVHGGGWFIGNKHQIKRIEGQLLTRRGYAVVSTSYRLTDVAAFPAQVHDVKAAIRWVRANAATYGFDPNRIGLWGASAGGHLVSLMGTTGDDPSLEGDLGGPALAGHSSRVHAVVNYFGISDVEAWQEPGETRVEQQDATDMITPFLGGPLEDHRDTARRASPIHYVDSGDAPFLHVHGDEDNLVSFEQSERLHRALEAAGADSTLNVIEGGSHGFGGRFNDLDALRDEAAAFFDEKLGPAAP